MLIIFDLDDTLIDTSGAVTPFKLRACLKRLIEMGLPVKNFEEAEKELIQIDLRSLRSKDALSQFLSEYSFPIDVARPAFSELTSPLPDDFAIPTTPNAKEILEFFRPFHSLALVTGGHPPFQREKMEKAGIEPAIFCKIEIPEDSVKKPVYEAILKEFSISPRDVWVCGDRIAMDLAPAKELGMRTIHIRWGRGGRRIEKELWVDHSIADLRELKGIIR